ncbi:MAG: VTT domain-containing protein [Pseudomonadota bacterium]
MRGYKRILIVLAFLLLLLAAFEFSGLRAHFKLVFLHQIIVEHQLGGLLIFIALFCLGNLIQIPGLVFLAAAVLALGRVWGGIATYIAAMSSCIFTYFTIRFIGGDALRELKNPYAIRLLAQLDQHPVKSVALLRTLFQTAPALNYVLSLSGVRFYQYLLGSLLGLPLPIALYCVFFDYLGKTLHLN